MKKTETFSNGKYTEITVSFGEGKTTISQNEKDRKGKSTLIFESKKPKIYPSLNSLIPLNENVVEKGVLTYDNSRYPDGQRRVFY